MNSVDGKPSRKVFSITNEGRSVLKEQISLFISEFETKYSLFDLGLMNLEILSKEEILDCLNSYLESINDKMDHYEDLQMNLSEMEIPFYITALASRPLYLLKAEKKWVQQFISEIESKMEE